MKKISLPVILVTILTAALLLTSCGSGGILPAANQPTLIPTVADTGAVTAEGRLVPRASSALTFTTTGEISEILVSEGDLVSEGTVLMRLGKVEALDAALAAAQLEELSAQQALQTLQDTAGLAGAQSAQALTQARQALLDAQETLDTLDTEDFRNELDDLTIAAEDAQEEVDDAQTELDKYDGVDSDNPGRKNAETALEDAQQAYDDAVYERDQKKFQLEQAENAVELARSALADAEQTSTDRQSGPDPDELALAQARLNQAQAQVAAARRALENQELTAPYESTVIDLTDLDPGEQVSPAKPVVTIADLTSWFVETRDLTELDVVSIEVGQKVSIVPDALPELQLTGEVVAVDQGFLERSGDILYTVRIRLDDTDPALRWGMTVTVTFEE